MCIKRAINNLLPGESPLTLYCRVTDLFSKQLDYNQHAYNDVFKEYCLFYYFMMFNKNLTAKYKNGCRILSSNDMN